MLISIFKEVYNPIINYPTVVDHLQVLLGKIVRDKEFVSGGDLFRNLELRLRQLPRWPHDYARMQMYNWATTKTTGWYITQLITVHYPEYKWEILPDEVRMFYRGVVDMAGEVQVDATVVLNDLLVELDETVENLAEKAVKLQLQIDLLCKYLNITMEWNIPPEPPVEIEYKGDNVIVFPGTKTQ